VPYVLDTNVITALQAGNTRVNARIATIPPTEIFVTVISLQEQLRGQLASLNDARVQANRSSLIRTYADFVATASFYFGQFAVLLYDDAAARIDEQLKTQRRPHGPMDRRIAAITLAHGFVLVTQNTVDFQRVPGLSIEDWMTP
jgi:tRNA(fMet)-specific endonuclease VapC